MSILQKLKGSLWSKTSNFAVIVTVIGLLEQTSPHLFSAVAPEYRGLVMSLVGVVFWLLRWVTTTPLDKR